MDKRSIYFKLFVLLISLLIFHSTSGRLINFDKQAPKGTIKTIKANNGDVVDCVNIHEQPAFEHPSLKRHKLQIEPSHYARIHRNESMLSKIFQPWQCPQGSIPIRRQVNTDTHKLRKSKSTPPASYNNGHQYSVTQLFYGSPAIQGAYATIDIWKPSLAIPASDFSLTQIWVTSGSGSLLNTMEVGWQVFPGRTGDAQPRFFIFWTADAYNATGCYDLTCPGFVQTNNQYSPGMALQPSVYQGVQYEFVLQIEKDQQSGNYWLYIYGTAIGYWPSSIFNSLQQGADTVEWGGEIYDSSGSDGFHTLTQMGSGYFPSQGYGIASYVRNLTYIDSSYNVVPVSRSSLQAYAPAPNCYNYQFEQSPDGSLSFFYGGPGCN
ncbi:hypothetical protein Droror1_Dr00006463 [Drosera rotundifolia]